MTTTTQPDTRDSHTKFMHTLFDLVCDPRDWRAPIKVISTPKLLDKLLGLHGATRSDLRDAVMFMTATELKETVGPDGTLTLTASGYRAGPAGP